MSGQDCCCFVCIPMASYGIVQRMGAHKEMIGAGLHCIACPIDTVAGIMSLRVRQLNVDVVTKTKDNVSITVVVAVQYCVHNPTAVDENTPTVGQKAEVDETPALAGVSKGSPLYDAFYLLTDVKSQINNYVENVVRGSVPRMDLDDVFSAKDTLNEAILTQLGERMQGFGYEIVQALVVELVPDGRVASAMNDINAQARMREAANHQAEAQKIVQVKGAEADGEAKYLSGMGVARQRKAIVEGLQETVNDFSSSVKGATSADVMDVLLMTQYFDMLKAMARTGAGGTLFLPHGPHSIRSLRNDLASSFSGKGSL